MDRIDIHMQVPRVEYQKLWDMRKGESSAEVRKRVETARECQRKRIEGPVLPVTPICSRQKSENTARWMTPAMRQLQLTARAYHRVLKLSRTIADLAGSEAINHAHLAEALQYRHKLDLM